VKQQLGSVWFGFSWGQINNQTKLISLLLTLGSVSLCLSAPGCEYLYWLSQMQNISVLSSWCFFTTKLHLVISLFSAVSCSNAQLHKCVFYYADYTGYHMKIHLQENCGLILKYHEMETRVNSVTNSSDGLIFVKRRAKDGRFFSKNTGVRRAKRRAKFKLCIKKARKFDSRHFNNKSA